MSAPRLSAEVKDRILLDYDSGVKTSVIAATYDVDPSYPSLLAKRRGLRARASPEAKQNMRLAQAARWARAT